MRASTPKCRPKGGTRIPPTVRASWTGPTLRRFGPEAAAAALSRVAVIARALSAAGLRRDVEADLALDQNGRPVGVPVFW